MERLHWTRVDTRFYNGQLLQPLAALMLATLHWISPATREVVIQLSTFQGIRTDVLARHITRRSRHQIARILAHDGLPCLKKLRMWVRLTGWLLQWESEQTSLYRLAIAQDMDPAACYRAVKKLTGLSWRSARARGLAWLLGELGKSCRPPIAIEKRSGGVTPAALVRQA